MTSRALWVLAGLAAACGGDAPSARARVLAKIPAGVTSVAAADARALAHPRFRPLVDVLRAELPAGFECVVDAALAGEQVAAGIAPSGDVTVALVTRAQVKCAALSKVDPDLWIATLGGGGPAAGSSVLGEHPRARPFLKDAPVALVTQVGALRVLATAQPDPLAAWVAFDAADVAAATAFERELKNRLHAAASNPAVGPVAAAIAVERTGSQVVVRLGATKAFLEVALRETLGQMRGRGVARTFPCPAPVSPPVMGCVAGEHDHNTLDVYSLASAFDEILAARKEVVIANGRAAGLRLLDDLVTYGLASGDVLVAVDGQRLTAVEQLAPSLKKAKARARLLITRLRRSGTIELVEH